MDNSTDSDLDELFTRLSEICEDAPRPIVLMVDEVDSASNNQVFLDFLAQLRGYYLARKNSPTFHSVILSDVYDIKNLKLKIRPDEAHRYNSPWNIAVKFKIEMAFSAEQIGAMLICSCPKKSLQARFIKWRNRTEASSFPTDISTWIWCLRNLQYTLQIFMAVMTRNSLRNMGGNFSCYT